MSEAIVKSQRGNFDFAFSLMMQFIDVCPDATWTKNFGGWPIWQQVHHTFAAVDFFISEPDAVPAESLVPQAVTFLATVGDTPVSKADMKAFAYKAKAAADEYMNTLTDAQLTQKATGASERMKRETTHASVMALMVGHLLYHLGTCDAALREQGLKGVF